MVKEWFVFFFLFFPMLSTLKLSLSSLLLQPLLVLKGPVLCGLEELGHEDEVYQWRVKAIVHEQIQPHKAVGSVWS